MKLLVALGNPGSKHAKNRHNLGWWWADAVREHYKLSTPQEKFHGLFSKGEAGNHVVGLLKPMTYMNDSGRSVQAAMQFFKLTLDDVWVVHDDLDLAPLKVRIKQGGGSGGHNGLKSVTQQVGADYHRLRLGVGHPGHKDEVSTYVLSDIPKAEAPAFKEVISSLVKDLPVILDSRGNDVLSQLVKK
jgi:PTH1 family peptidyl-tRNA hydrolase